jgi:LPXTG-motif cell wall-anchored protein
MRTIRALSTLALAAALTVIAAQPAHAQEYPPAAPSLTVDKSAVTPTETFTISGTGFGAGDSLSVTGIFQPTSGAAAPPVTRTATADANGDFVLTLRASDFATVAQLQVGGSLSLTAVASPSGRTGTATVRVTAAAAGLPATGQDASFSFWALAGAAALALGVALLLLRRTVRYRRSF